MQPEHHNEPTLCKLYICVCHTDNSMRNLSNKVTVYLQAALQRGIETLSQAEVGSALQVYFNLGLLRKVPAPASMHVFDSLTASMLLQSLLKYQLQCMPV